MDNPTEEFENCLTLWLPTSPDLDSNLVRKLDRCSRALNSLMETKISWQDYLDVLQTEGIQMDDYINIAHENVIRCGL